MKYFLAILVLLSACVVTDDSYASEIKLSDYDDLVVETYKYKSVAYMQCHYAGVYMREAGIMDKVVEVYIGHPAILDDMYKDAWKVLGDNEFKRRIALKPTYDLNSALMIMNSKKCKEPAQYVVRKIYGE
ncbi:hypothetical protein NVP1031O_002 [Vibrio phage 1.031.O._10N.261.46.F8]|nr:hypothetical protein NVP1031O_002 [Vibrio phage 1.031.O._10N.261.46.F8]